MKVFFSRILAWLPERDYLQHLQAKNELGDAEDVEEVTNEVVVVVLQLLLSVPAVAMFVGVNVFGFGHLPSSCLLGWELEEKLL